VRTSAGGGLPVGMAGKLYKSVAWDYEPCSGTATAGSAVFGQKGAQMMACTVPDAAGSYRAHMHQRAAAAQILVPPPMQLHLLLL
jgi:hypothetical protein